MNGMRSGAARWCASPGWSARSDGAPVRHAGANLKRSAAQGSAGWLTRPPWGAGRVASLNRAKMCSDAIRGWHSSFDDTCRWRLELGYELHQRLFPTTRRVNASDYKNREMDTGAAQLKAVRNAA